MRLGASAKHGNRELYGYAKSRECYERISVVTSTSASWLSAWPRYDCVGQAVTGSLSVESRS